ncbi:MAG: tRNA-2-methylthio-N6-dimethylallyladenosine synthase [Clostridia bacterium]|nr:tRNA-2-methylthio-N6-dimethylallyladenosine synthase [Clostridia bacterium]
MNERDGEIAAGLMEEAGFTPANDEIEADVLVLLTCCVREKAENKVYGKLGELQKLKKKNPELIIAVGGCMMQQPGVAEKVRQLAPHVDVIFGTHNLHQLPELLRRVRELRQPVVAIWAQEGEVIEGLPARRAGGSKALVNISFGCNNFCSYCIVPYVRGRERSRNPESILSEIRRLVDEGVIEVTLLGQNVNSYGRDLGAGINFVSLLEQVNSIPGLERIRFLTSHPRDFNPDLVKAMARLEKICEHVHLPVQAGSNRVLERMNRGYTREDYFRLVDSLRAAIPDISITTDLIVGFPGESEGDFAQTLDLVERVQFDNAFTFMFSPRRGTPAADYPEQLPLEVKKERLSRLMEVQNAISRRKNEVFVGKEVEVLAEGHSKTDPEKISGRTRGNKLVIFAAPEDVVGRLVKVHITSAQTFLLKGEYIDALPKTG